MNAEPFAVWRSFKFLFVGPLILALLFVINWFTFHGYWWVKWAALGLGIAWLISFFRVLKTVVILGGLAALIACLRGQSKKI